MKNGMSYFFPIIFSNHVCLLFVLYVAKSKFSTYFLRSSLSNYQPSTFLFTTQAFPLEQKVVGSIVKDEVSAEGGESTSGQKTKNKTKQSKKKKDKKNAKTGEAVKDINSSEVDNTASKQQDSAACKKKKEKQSKSTANSKNKKGKNNAKAVEAIKDGNAIEDQENIVLNIEKKQSSTAKYAATDTKIQTGQLNTDIKGGNTLKDRSRQHSLDNTFSKAAGASPAIESFDNDEVHHPLHFSPDAVLIEAEEDLQGDNKFKDTHVIDSADVEVESVEDPTFQSKEETHSKSEPGQHFKDRSFKDGTPGGRLFKEETLAEIDAYLYLGKVSFD